MIVGSETHPPAIDRVLGRGAQSTPHVIGDFTWTGWDYLGEAGIGRTVYGTPDPAQGMQSFHGEYPYRTAWCGDIDITGYRRPQSYYREIVFGLRSDPYLAVRSPVHHGEAASGTPWSWSDVVSSWSWVGHEGAPVTVEVYADADEVELLLNAAARSADRPAGQAAALPVDDISSDTTYETGRLEAAVAAARRDRDRPHCRSASATEEVRL